MFRASMSSGKTVGLAVGVWLIVISLLHATLNLGAFAPGNVGANGGGFLPVGVSLKVGAA